MTEIRMQECWEKLHSQRRFRPKYPHELVIQFLFRHFKRDGKERVLDLGCGAGRHVILMGKEGIVPYGIDISSNGVDYTRRLLKQNGLEEFSRHIVCGNFTNIPFKDCFFNGVIAFGSLYYGDIKMIQDAFQEIYRICKPGGFCFFLVRGCNDCRFGMGEKIEKNTFIINCLDENISAFAENAFL